MEYKNRFPDECRIAKRPRDPNISSTALRVVLLAYRLISDFSRHSSTDAAHALLPGRCRSVPLFR